MTPGASQRNGESLQPSAHQESIPAPRRIAITGTGGLIGSAIARRASESGFQVTRLVRRAAAHPGEISWDPSAGRIDAAGLEGHDAVIHLAGETIASLWTPGRKRRIRESRVDGTALLARALVGFEHPPATLIVASGVHYYGIRGTDEPVDESAGPGEGFLAEVVHAWEAAASPARDAGIRVVHMRFGLVLSRRGGVLPTMLPAFRLGLGGPLGTGRQWLSWIALDDVIRAALFIVHNARISGPVNFTAPEPVTNAEFTRVLARVLKRPAPFRLPAWLLRLLPGGMGEELLLGGIRAVPRRLLEAGFTFEYPSIDAALTAVLRPDAG
ncbi:MAG TPA: TIGR01777 family oxidoreductase [Longimicrobiales bacterium]|nr:TIGR01777 family oxidoreductase [Longimicrobiales bacterium]